jgi:SAM-dependent methyltransferase
MTQGAFNSRDFAQEVGRFEEMLFVQKPVSPEHYDASYFTDGWRDAGNRYDLETRRRIEGPHPALIRDVFRPSRVLDVGCGPGFLVYFLRELQVEADGIDFSSEARELGPAEIRDCIRIADITTPSVPDSSYDLVLCREVFEHLTVLQIRRSVETICRASSRFVYLTTRFHPAPESLLDFTTQFDVDPTHITLLNKEFLRCLFNLEGFHSRSDLEERLDWARKGRVLVYERQQR